MLKVGIIGCGGIGNLHAHAYCQIKEVELVALIDSDIQKAEALVEKYGGKAYKCLDDVPESLDLVSVVTPPATHYPIVMDLLDRRIPVFCEKPITTDVAQAKELLKRSKEAGVPIGIGFKMRYESVFVKAKELIGELGPLFGLTVTKNQPFNADDYRNEWIKKTGCMYELSVHDYDLVNWIMDAVPVSVEADLRYADGWTREDKAFLNIEYSNGVKGQLMSSYSKNSKWVPNDVTMVFVGENGTMRVERPDRIVMATQGTRVIEVAPIGGLDVFVVQMQAFVDKLIAGERYLPGIEDGALNTILIESGNRAFREGKKVSLDDM